MGRLLTCLIVLVVACGDDDDGRGDAGAAGGVGGSGSSGRSAVAGRSGGAAAHGGNDTGPHSGRSGAAGRPGGPGGGNGGGPALGAIKLVPNIVAGRQIDGSNVQSLRIGTPSAASLYSLKYYITSIQLCEDLQLQGSGFSNPQGCIDLYRNQDASAPDYSAYRVSEAQADNTPDRYIDLMTAEGQAALRKPVSLQVPIAAPPAESDLDAGVGEPTRQPGVYRFGLINFYRPIKVRADFPIIGADQDDAGVGAYFRTKAVTAIHPTSSPGGGPGRDRVEIGDTLSGATEETTYMLDNGGALFVFQKPFAITQADVDAKAEIKVDLVFNPESFGQVYEVPDCVSQTWVTICDQHNGVAIDMPFVRMSPVPRKSGEKTRKETYLIDHEAHSKLRLEMYYNDADPEAGIQGVDIAVVYLPSASNASGYSINTVASNFVTQTGSVRTNNASVTLLDYRVMTSLEGLVRRRASGSVTLHCLFTGSACPTLGGSYTRAYQYLGDTLVSSD